MSNKAQDLDSYRQVLTFWLETNRCDVVDTSRPSTQWFLCEMVGSIGNRGNRFSCTSLSNRTISSSDTSASCGFIVSTISEDFAILIWILYAKVWVIRRHEQAWQCSYKLLNKFVEQNDQNPTHDVPFSDFRWSPNYLDVTITSLLLSPSNLTSQSFLVLYFMERHLNLKWIK
jgi:hypothetical protein